MNHPTSHRRTTSALEDPDQRFQVALQGAINGVWNWNPATDEIYFSPLWKSMLGFDDEDIKNRLDSWKLLVHPDDIGRVLDCLFKVWGSEKTFETEFRMRHKDGHYVDILSRASATCDEKGKVVRIVGTHLDISHYEPNQRCVQLAALVFMNAREGIVVTNPDTCIIAVNPAFCLITGYCEAELLGQKISILQSGRQGPDFYREMWRSINEEGRWCGEIWNRRKCGEIYPEWLTIGAVRDEGGQVVNYVGIFVDISSLVKQSEERLQHIAHHDPLTNLPNRLLLSSRLEQAITRAKRSGKAGAVLFIDLDRFKDVNDGLGHPAGDELLKLVAQRLLKTLRSTDTLARLGGDEFVVVLEGLASPKDAGNIAGCLIRELSDRPFALAHGHDVILGASIGIAVFPTDGETPDDLIQHADTALYEAKGDGKATYRRYSAASTEAASERLKMVTRLRRALEQKEFVLHYQPLVSLCDGKIKGVEALVRWRHPEIGLIPPVQFIPLAEETGLIIPLGEWVLRTACLQMKKWLTMGTDICSISVNLSSRQFQQSDIHERVRAILEETALPGHNLELEITENTLLREDAAILLKMTCLKALGVRIAIDDFGTGYSSLAYLKQFPIDCLKIDKSFVRDIAENSTDMQIVVAIIGFAKALGLKVLAEGIETKQQLDVLKRLGSDKGQGFLFSRPLPAEELGPLLGVEPVSCSSFQVAGTK